MKYAQPRLIEEPYRHGGRRPGAGRPSNKSRKVATTVRVVVYITKSQLSRLETLAKSPHQTISACLRDLLTIYLDDYMSNLK